MACKLHGLLENFANIFFLQIETCVVLVAQASIFSACADMNVEKLQ